MTREEFEDWIDSLLTDCFCEQCKTKNMSKHFEIYIEDVQPLVEALEFYSTYTSGELDPNGEYTRVDIGMEARQALEAYKK